MYHVKRIVDGKIYDSMKASFICGADCGFHHSDLHWEDTSLFKSQKGTYFLAGRGGAFSRWQVAVENGRAGGSGVQVLSAFEAKQFAEANMSADDYITEFGAEEG